MLHRRLKKEKNSLKILYCKITIKKNSLKINILQNRNCIIFLKFFKIILKSYCFANCSVVILIFSDIGLHLCLCSIIKSQAMVLHKTDCGKFTDDVIHYERDKEMKEQSYETFMFNVILLLVNH